MAGGSRLAGKTALVLGVTGDVAGALTHAFAAEGAALVLIKCEPGARGCTLPVGT